MKKSLFRKVLVVGTTCATLATMTSGALAQETTVAETTAPEIEETTTAEETTTVLEAEETTTVSEAEETTVGEANSDDSLPLNQYAFLTQEEAVSFARKFKKENIIVTRHVIKKVTKSNGFVYYTVDFYIDGDEILPYSPKSDPRYQKSEETTEETTVAELEETTVEEDNSDDSLPLNQYAFLTQEEAESFAKKFKAENPIVTHHVITEVTNSNGLVFYTVDFYIAEDEILPYSPKSDPRYQKSEETTEETTTVAETEETTVAETEETTTVTETEETTVAETTKENATKPEVSKNVNKESKSSSKLPNTGEKSNSIIILLAFVMFTSALFMLKNPKNSKN